MELEKNLLNSLTTTEGVKQAFDEGLREEHFKNTENRGIFVFIKDYWFESNQAPTPAVVKEEFPHFDLIEPEESLTWLIDKVKNRFLRLQVEDVLAKSAELSHEGDHQKALSLLQGESWWIAQSMADRRSAANLADENNLLERRNRYRERALFEGDVRGVPLGFPEIDAHIFGLLPGELCSVAGYSGTGKTWMLLLSAVAAWRAGYKPYIVSLEVAKEDIEDRLDCIMSGVPYTKVLQGSLDRNELTALKEAQDLLASEGFLIVDNPPLGERDVQTIINKAVQAGADFLVIDQLSFITPRHKHNQLREAYGEIIHELKAMISADKHKMACMLAVQFNRAQQDAKNRGGMQNIGEASFVERASDFVYGLTQTNEMRVNNSMAFDIMKTRRQYPKSWQLNWELKNRTRFSVDMEIIKED